MRRRVVPPSNAHPKWAWPGHLAHSLACNYFDLRQGHWCWLFSFFYSRNCMIPTSPEFNLQLLLKYSLFFFWLISMTANSWVWSLHCQVWKPLRIAADVIGRRPWEWIEMVVVVGGLWVPVLVGCQLAIAWVWNYGLNDDCGVWVG